MPPEMLIYRWYATTYHWTPEQVDALPLDAFTWLMPIEMASDEAARHIQERETRHAQSQARARRR